MSLKGRQALFFVLGLLVVASAVWHYYPRPVATASPPDLWIFYARATSTQEVLYGRRYSPQGVALNRPIRLGRLGLVQPIEVASAGPSGHQWVTTGRTLLVLGRHRVIKTIPAPAGYDLLSVKSISGALYGVAESLHGSSVVIDRLSGGAWVMAKGGLPLGITTLAAGPHRSVWVLVADPRRADLQEIWPGQQSLVLKGMEPQGTLGFGGGMPVITYADGSNGFGWWDGQRHPFRSVYQAAISVSDTSPLWGLGVRGMIPFRGGRFDLAQTAYWPGRETTTPQVVGSGPWIAVMDGFSQGRWFNVDSGRFGPSFQIKTPWWAVVRAASLGS